ncbi:MAG: hypothetical protein Homavirus18_10 [Homavirus sp.]|uniref:Uncharacterized protein n=1 Tax=Homavirus sp. TaxID=2487769 RepID=A0A3G5A4R7_9VIRU|nr:MAG: hypothetical protein Homavirus18_10 [Homavirus sp.]
MNNLKLAIMVKNEETTIIKTLNTCIPYVGTIFMYDTGSTDNTIKLVENFCNNNSINLNLLCGEFESYSISRNKLLDYVESHSFKDEFILLMDANDELTINPTFNPHEFPLTKKVITGYSYWNIGSSVVCHFKILFIRAHNKLRYEGTIHEYIKMDGTVLLDNDIQYVKKDQIMLYQDRIEDELRTLERAKSDIILLKEAVSNNIYIGRNYYQLGRTYYNIGMYDKSLKYFTKGVDLNENITVDEKFQCHYYLAVIKKNKNDPEWLNHIIEAYELLPNKIEGVLLLCEILTKANKWNNLYVYSKMAIKLARKFEKTVISTCVLYNDTDYNLYCYYYYGLACFNLQKYKKAHTMMLIMEKNLKQYNDRVINAFNLHAHAYATMHSLLFPLHYLPQTILNESIVLYTNKKYDDINSNIITNIITTITNKYNKICNIVVFCDIDKSTYMNNVCYLHKLLYDIYLPCNKIHTLFVFDCVDYIKYYDNIDKVVLYMENNTFSGVMLRLHNKLKHIICKSELDKTNLLNNMPDFNKIKYKIKVVNEGKVVEFV